MKDIYLDEYDYELPIDRIAQYPVPERDMSQLLIHKEKEICIDLFRNISDYIPSDSLLVFNNTKVIRARILFLKETGAAVEVLCLEPLSPVEYELAFSSGSPVEWKCIIGNLKKWKRGKIGTTFIYNKQKVELSAEIVQPFNEVWNIRFSWNCKDMSFGEIIEAIGHIPLPPYINRDDEEEDSERYQTIYSTVKGSVAAPTAGLHFTNYLFEKLGKKGIKSVDLTLHVGAGTFQPVKSEKIADHLMHCEHFTVTDELVKLIIENHGKIIPVGTTSVRTLESLYWLGVKLIQNPDLGSKDLSLGQWEPYEIETAVSVKEAMESILNFLNKHKQNHLNASTSIIIVPGYNFRIIDGMITNFHQPRSTLLLLVSCWLGSNWRSVYQFALEKNFRFLSYGDSSLLLR